MLKSRSLLQLLQLIALLRIILEDRFELTSDVCFRKCVHPAAARGYARAEGIVQLVHSLP